jgi:uracil-DNA glycosylase family 4
MFTGDRSGDFLFRALHTAGFASQPASRSRTDGLSLKYAYIRAVIRCAPPGNRPAPDQILNCREYLEQELDLLANLKVVVALGRVAFGQYLTILRLRGIIRSKSGFVFAHCREHITAPGQPLLISSYHPSQQNTSTKRLTDEMLKEVFLRARSALRSLP